MCHGEGEERYHRWQSGCGPPGSSHSVPVSSTWLSGSGTKPFKYKKILYQKKITGLVQAINSVLPTVIKRNVVKYEIVALTDLNPSLCELSPQGQLLPGVHVRVVRLLKHFLQLLQLKCAEGGAIAPLLVLA